MQYIYEVRTHILYSRAVMKYYLQSKRVYDNNIVSWCHGEYTRYISTLYINYVYIGIYLINKMIK